MNEEEINKMCSDIYEGEDWQPMKDYIKSLQTQLQQKENIIKEITEYVKSKEFAENFPYVMNECQVRSIILKILDKEKENG